MARAEGMERLGAQVHAGDVAAVTRACTALDGTTRSARGRAEVVADGARILSRGWWSDDGFTRDHVEAASIAVTALATMAELRRLRHHHLPEDTDLATMLLTGRGREFCDEWVRHAVDRLDARDIRVARRLVHGGQADKPDTEAYTVALVGLPQAFSLVGERSSRRAGPGPTSVLAVLRANPDLLVDDVWRVFEVEGGGEHSLAAHDKYCAEEAGWQAALLALGADGTLDRDRLLDASLDALQRGFSPFRAQWFSAFHEALSPTPAERAARATTYLALTASPVGATVSLAVRALVPIQKAGGLDPVEVVTQIGPALLTPAKGAAGRAVALLARAGDDDPAVLAEAARAMTAALAHPARDVQERALGHLRRWFADAPGDLADQVQSVAPGCHPAVQGQITAWLGDTPAGTLSARPAPTRSASTGKTSTRATSTGKTSTRATSTGKTPTGARTTGTDDGAPARSTPDPLDTSRALRPVEDRDELFELASTVLERAAHATGATEADDAERLLTAAAAVGRDAVAGDGRARTLVRRATRLLGSKHPAQRLVARALVAWLDPATLEATDHLPERPAGQPILLDELLLARMASVTALLRAGAPVQLLAAPTHRHGFIDPVVLTRRLTGTDPAIGRAHATGRAHTGGGPAPAQPVSTSELTSALLRLAPDPARLAEARDRLTRSGLVPPTVPAWMEQWAALAETDDGCPATWTHTLHHLDGGYTYAELHLDGLGPITPPPSPWRVTLGIGRWGGAFSQDPLGVHWTGSLIPGRPGAWARWAIAAIGPTAGTREVAHGDPAYLERFFDPAVPLPDSAHLLVAFALNDPRPDLHTVAIDLTVVALDDGRVDPVRLGDHIGRLAGTALVTPSRWGRSLASVAEHGDHHRRAVTACLAGAVGTAEPRRSQDLLALLELLEQALVTDQRALTDERARVALARIAGTGRTNRTSRTSRTAARILALGQP